MAYRFLFGASGAGKSHELHTRILHAAMTSMRAFSDTNYFLIVPEQYTMQTQKDLVLESPMGGILNVDVLSFGRLSHRIFEEVGADDRTVLGDIGKSLILQRLAGKMEEELPAIGSSLHRQGYIAEVKSVISEFMQYGLSPEDVGKLADYAEGRGALRARLRDLKKVYEQFLTYEHEEFVTTEETLDLLAQAIPTSGLIRNAVICFDGFTGFTPVQNRVIGELMRCAKEVVFTLTLSEDGGRKIGDCIACGDPGEEQALFYLTRRTAVQISGIAKDLGVPHAEDIFLPGEMPYRFRANPWIAYLEKALFRYPVQPAAGNENGHGQGIALYEASTPYEEVRHMFIRMKRLVAEKGYAYRDFAVLAGDLGVYEDPIRRLAAIYHVPVYLDTTRAVLHNPLTETIRAALSVRIRDFSYETVFRYLRGGLCDLTREEIDLLENYCLSHGIHGRKRWEMSFDADEEPLRVKVMEGLGPLLDLNRANAGERTRALGEFLAVNRMQEKMEEKAAGLEAAGDLVRADEYRQIYSAVTDFLAEILDILAEEPIAQDDYLELIDTGIREIRLGTLPQQADVCLTGDLERSRLTQVKVLFVLGANDGNIPKGTGKGGIISDLDREFLAKSGIELSPTPRDEMFTQRLYLYLGLTKPSELLCVSFADVDAGGKSIRPSYLISLLIRMFPDICPEGRIERPEEEPVVDKITGEEDTLPFLAEGLRRLAEGRYENTDEKRLLTEEGAEFFTLYGAVLCGGSPAARDAARMLTRAAFRRYMPRPLSRQAADGLYGRTIAGSVSRLEKTAECYKKQFLQYGLRLKERDEFVFRPVDSGTIMHASLDAFAGELRAKGLTWQDFDTEKGKDLAAEMVRRTAETYGSRVLHATAKGEYMLLRMQMILRRTVEILQYQIRCGSFEPVGHEISFGGMEKDSPEGLYMKLDETRAGKEAPGTSGAADGAPAGSIPAGSRMYLGGRIDRLDLAKDEEGSLYVKVVDYKSGSRDLDREKIRDGLQLQLMLYMEETLSWLRKENPGREVYPAALFYYRLFDPYVKEDGKNGIETVRRKELRPKGMVSSSPAILSMLDTAAVPSGTSEVIPISYGKDGGPGSRCRNTFTPAEYEILAGEVREVSARLAGQILAGNITTEPFVKGKENACTYCAYKDVCGYDVKVPGYRTKDSN